MVVQRAPVGACSVFDFMRKYEANNEEYMIKANLEEDGDRHEDEHIKGHIPLQLHAATLTLSDRAAKRGAW